MVNADACAEKCLSTVDCKSFNWEFNPVANHKDFEGNCEMLSIKATGGDKTGFSECFILKSKLNDTVPNKFGKSVTIKAMSHKKIEGSDYESHQCADY